MIGEISSIHTRKVKTLYFDRNNIYVNIFKNNTKFFNNTEISIHEKKNRNVNVEPTY